MTAEAPKYLGIYRGTVINNVDPLQQGRLQAISTDVAGLTPTTWATPCAAMAGIQAGVFTLPPIGAGVWLRHGVAREAFSVEQGHEVALLLLVGAVVGDDLRVAGVGGLTAEDDGRPL